jgi:hypothetical protein
MAKDRVTDAHAKGGHDSKRDAERYTGWGDTILEITTGNPYYRPPKDQEEREAYNKGWRDARK